MMVLQLSILLLFSLLLGQAHGISPSVYYVKPTSQPANLNCPHNMDHCPNTPCNTIDDYAKNHTSFFTSDKIDIKLVFMCGYHHSTIGLNIMNRQALTLAMVGEITTVVFNMSNHTYSFTRTKKVIIDSLRIIYPSFAFIGKETNATVRNSLLSSNQETSHNTFITIDKGCKFLLDNCTIQRNVFIHVDHISTLALHNTKIRSYLHHDRNSACINANQSKVIISGSMVCMNIGSVQAYGSNTVTFSVIQSTLYVQNGTHFRFSNNFAETAINLLDSTMDVNANAHIEFRNNTAYSTGGAIFISIKSKIYIKENVNLYFIEINYGAISISNSVINVYNNSRLFFYNNTAKLQSAAVDMHMSGINLYDNAEMYFVNNTARQNGGAISIRRFSRLNVNDQASINFTGNTAVSGNGGAVHIWHGGMTVKSSGNVLFSNNIAGHSGGAIYAEHAQTSLTLTAMVDSYNHSFVNNSAAYGGAIQLNYSTLAIQSCIAGINFSSNHALSNGGALHMINSNLTVQDEARVYFTGNQATSLGGAIYQSFHSNFTVTENTLVYFTNNIAISGGAVDLFTSDIFVENAQMELISNSASELGGALYLDTANVYVSNNASVTYKGNTAFQGGAIFQYSAAMKLQNRSSFTFVNNTSTQGGAIYAISMSALHIKLRNESKLNFDSNRASDVGGGICVAAQEQYHVTCFYPDYDNTGMITFDSNVAENGGDHIYGASLLSDECNSEKKHGELLPVCPKQDRVFKLHPTYDEINSPISSEPKRVCLCDSQNRPQCANFSKVFVPNVQLYPGQTLQLSAVVTGLDLGATRGKVYAKFLSFNRSDLAHPNQYTQFIPNSKQCSNLEYTIHSVNKEEILCLQTNKYESMTTYGEIKQFNKSVEEYYSSGCLNRNLLTSPVFINITFLPCPPGFTLYGGSQLPGCECYSVLAQNNFNCSFINDTGYLMWNTTVWINATASYNDSQSTGIIYNRFCPLDYCKSSQKKVNLEHNPNGQCDYNHAGRLCGGCKENYSLAIGSSHCIPCINSNNLVLLFFFAFAGVLLALFILALNLTVTQGLVNCILFYANIVWAYKNIIFPPTAQLNPALYFLKVFIAWMNLDFGIEACFIKGLDAFWKTWLQFVFPFYIWGIAGFIILTAHFSTRATYVIGDRAVPLLATIIFLSYMKVLQTIVTSLSVAMISVFPEGSSYAVWYQDGNLLYFGQPHVYLFVAALIALVFLWLPYTLILLLMQWLRKNTHLILLRWIPRFHPFYDNNFAPLNDNHRYWFGTLLVIRAFLLLVVTLTADISPSISLLILLTTVTLLLLYKSIVIIYKQKSVSVFENICFVNLILLCGGIGLRFREDYKVIIAGLSLGFMFFQFCSIIIWNLIKKCKCTQKCLKQLGSPEYVQIGDDMSSDNN